MGLSGARTARARVAVGKAPLYAVGTVGKSRCMPYYMCVPILLYMCPTTAICVLLLGNLYAYTQRTCSGFRVRFT